jgi:hypothetical protein
MNLDSKAREEEEEEEEKSIQIENADLLELKH